MSVRAASRGVEAIITCAVPDVCLTPQGGGMIPVPYMIVARFELAEHASASVLLAGEPAFTMGSRLPRVTGDEAGVGGGILSGVNCGYCRPITHSGTVMVDGEYVVRDGDMMEMNCAGPDGPANTYGFITILEDVSAAAAPQTVKSAATVAIDPDTGEVTVEERSVLRDPTTSAVIEVQQRSVIDPATGEIRTQRVAVATKPDGARSYEAASGRLDPVTRTYAWKATAGTLPDAYEPGGGELSVGDDGRLYLGGNGEGGAFETLPEGGAEEIADNDPELLAEPDLKAALEEQAAAELEREALDREAMWEGAKMGADVAGIFDPTPASDIIGGAMCAVDGDWIGLGLSVVAIVPYFGDALAKPAKGTRTAGRLARLGEKLAALGRKVEKLSEASRKALARAKEAVRKRRKGGGLPELPGKPKNPGDGIVVPKGRHTRPSGTLGGKPRGKPTKVNPADDEATRLGHTRENETANRMAQKGYDVEQNPPKKPNGKRPDYKIEGEYFDNYTPNQGKMKSTTLQGRLKSIRGTLEDKLGNGQAERFTVNLDDAPDVSIADVQRDLARNPIPGVKEVIVLKGGDIVHVFP